MSTAVQDIEELQRGLHVVFPEVEADGDIGRVTIAAVTHVRDTGITRLARFIQALLQRTTPALVVDGRIGDKTMAALRRLDELGDIESAAETPRLEGDRHVVEASSFADPADVAAFQKCKVRGGSDLHCFSLGDNGIGARGANCAQTDRPMIALPREIWRHDGAVIASATTPGTAYVITFAGRDLEAELGDTMPSVHNIKNGAGMDTNPAVAEAFNRMLGRVALEAPFMASMAWRLKAMAAVAIFVWLNLAAPGVAADAQGRPAAVEGLRPATSATSWLSITAWPLAAVFLADGPIPHPPAGTFEPWLLNMCMALAILVLILTAVALIMRLFGKQPPPAPATPQPLIVTMKEQFVELEVFEELKTDVHNQIKDMRGYLHEGMHDIRKDLQKIVTTGEEREQRLVDKLDTHWKELTREKSASTARVHDKIDSMQNLVRQEVDAKIKEVHGEIGQLPGRIVAMLRDTGAIGGRAK